MLDASSTASLNILFKFNALTEMTLIGREKKKAQGQGNMHNPGATLHAGVPCALKVSVHY
jgi:hypothetical protein